MNQPKTSKAEAWQIGGEYITDLEGNPRFRVMGSAPYNTAWMNRAVKAVNEYDALCVVAETAKNLLGMISFLGIQGAPEFQTKAERTLESAKAALSALAALRSKEHDLASDKKR